MSYFAIILLFLTFCGSIYVYGHDVPIAFPDKYVTTGVLYLPYAEIAEQFEAYYNGPAKKSRIDFYNGMVRTYQRADVSPYGVSYKIAPITTEKVLNKRMCFRVNGTKSAPIVPQSVLPDVDGFQKTGMESIRGFPCIKMQKVVREGLKKNTYTLWVHAISQQPIRYEMFGYDTLLGSHYDKYYLDYFEFMAGKFDDSFFNPPANLSCGSFPGPGSHRSRVLINPIREFTHHHDAHVHEMFNEFKVTHKKTYSTSHEHEQRKHNFRQNLRFIDSKNRAGLSYSLAVNHMADFSDSEFSRLRGYFHTPGNHGGLPYTTNPKANIPSYIDWRILGAVTPVKDQGVCGSCWSFGTTGTIEGSYFLKTGQRVRLSQQELVDCSWGEGNNGCDGGEDFRAYDWIKKHGLTSEARYGPYLAQDAYCHANNVTAVTYVKGFVNVTQYSVQALKSAIANHGPISVAIDAAHKSLSFYSYGLYEEPKCGNKPDQLDHAVLAVGYGTMNGQGYWLIKNSWSTYWGNAGYFTIVQKDNNCGVMTAPTFALL